MSRMRREIVQCMSNPARSGDELSARFRFPEEFVGFQGHFPEKKILPGICQVQCALSLLERHGGRRIALREIVQAKFFTPVLPGEEIVCVYKEVPAGPGEFTVKALLSKGGQKVCDLKMRVLITSEEP